MHVNDYMLLHCINMTFNSKIGYSLPDMFMDLLSWNFEHLSIVRRQIIPKTNDIIIINYVL